MATISELKELGVTQTPLFLFQFHLASGTVLYWSTHCVEVDGVSYEARVTGHNLFEMRSDANEGIDNLGRISVTLANADSYCSQIERAIGWKGAQVTVRFLFFDLHGGRPASEATVVFSGVANAPDDDEPKVLVRSLVPLPSFAVISAPNTTRPLTFNALSRE